MSRERKTINLALPIDGIIVDTTVDPMMINLHTHGIKISVPVDAEMHKLMQRSVPKYRLVLEMQGDLFPESGDVEK